MKNLPVQVDTFTMNGHLESSKIIDHANSSDRKWLGNHSFWALRNSRIVETRPITEQAISSRS
jgi:hypothetical protein